MIGCPGRGRALTIQNALVLPCIFVFLAQFLQSVRLNRQWLLFYVFYMFCLELVSAQMRHRFFFVSFGIFMPLRAKSAAKR